MLFLFRSMSDSSMIGEKVAIGSMCPALSYAISVFQITK